MRVIMSDGRREKRKLKNKMIKFHWILDNSGNKIRCVRTSDVQPAPENLKMYPSNSIEFAILKEFMEFEHTENGIANHTEIEVDLYSGMVFGGCQRTLVAHEDGYTYLRAKPSPKKYNEMSTWEILEYIQKVNIDGKRDEHRKSVIVNVYNGLKKAFDEEFPTKSFRHSNAYKDFIEARGVQGPQLTKLLLIGEKRPELLDQIDDGTLVIGKAWKIAKNAVKQPTPIDPERFNFLGHFDTSPTFKNKLKSGVLEAVDYFRKTPICGKQLVDNEQFGFEYPMISAHFSNIINSTAAFSYVEVDKEVKTGRKALASHGDSRPDIYFPTRSKDGFQEEKIEVKVASWTSTASTCIFYGGPGTKNCHPHEYLLGIHSDGGNQMFLMLATLTPEDWENPTSNEKYKMTLGTWFKNHFEKKDYRFLIGNISRAGNQKKVPHVNFNV